MKIQKKSKILSYLPWIHCSCSHENETGCAVRQAVKDGLIAEERYRAYMKLKAENAYNKNAVDYLAAKKRKFKQIAKLNKHNYKQ